MSAGCLGLPSLKALPCSLQLLPAAPPLPCPQVTQAVAQVDAAQKITVQANGAADFSNTDMARVRAAAAARAGAAGLGCRGCQVHLRAHAGCSHAAWLGSTAMCCCTKLT